MNKPKDSGAVRIHAIPAALGLGALLFLIPGWSDICKWVDEDGVTHYADRCPENVGAEQVEITPPPSAERIEEARRQAESLQRQMESSAKPARASGAYRSLTLEALGPLPENAISTYLETLGADLTFSFDDLTSQFALTLRAREGLKPGAYLEVNFPDPADPSKTSMVSRTLAKERLSVQALAPKSASLKCWNYEVEVLLYADGSKTELLGSHRQTIQSRFDLKLVRDAEDLLDAMAAGGRCPAARGKDLERMSADELAQLCEAEREKRLKPQREAKIRQCKAEGRNSDEWCENYWADFGNAKRISPTELRPALYYDLPECITANRARERDR